MKRLLCAVAAIALIAPQVAVAQTYVRTRTTAHGVVSTRVTRQRVGPHRTRTVRTTRVTRRNGARPTTRVVRTTTVHNYYRIGRRPATFHRIRVTRFVYPRGYAYRRWAVGAVIPRVFRSPSYYWNDWSALGLLPPPPGYVWVRFGPDLLLVNRYTGRVADVIYGAFY